MISMQFKPGVRYLVLFIFPVGAVINRWFMDAVRSGLIVPLLGIVP